MSGKKVWVGRQKWYVLKMVLGLMSTPHLIHLLCHNLVGDTKSIKSFVKVRWELVVSLQWNLLWDMHCFLYRLVIVMLFVFLKDYFLTKRLNDGPIESPLALIV